MIRHTVVFKLIHGRRSQGESAFFAAVAKLSAIPGVRNFEIMRQISPKNEYDYGLSMEFQSMQEYEVYNQHPAHTTFVRDIWIPSVERFMELDFEPVG